MVDRPIIAMIPDNIQVYKIET